MSKEAPATVTGRDGKKYPAKRKKSGADNWGKFPS
jgi:hypothetical protein